MDKSPDAFRTISEVAEHLETPAHVLRFWESRFPQIRPVKRAGGRRYYRPSDVSLLMGIKRLLHDEGLTIRGVQKILREQGVRHVAGLSGDALGDDAAANAFFIDQVDDDAGDVIVPMTVEPTPFRPAPGLAEAMAKAVDHGPPHVPAPSMPLPRTEPAQGALLLTPTPMPVTPVEATEADKGATPAVEQTILDVQAALQSNATGTSVVAENRQTAFPEMSPVHDDFDDDDFDDGPTITLAARIRALPDGASAKQVGAGILAITSRLQALRDRMADAARPGRS